jgi:type IV pilus assembly protein PilP
MSALKIGAVATRVFAVVMLVVAVAGCMRGIDSSYDDAKPLRQWVDEIRASTPPTLEPLPVMQQFETFEYSAQNLRDPFSDAWDNSDSGGLRPDPNRRKEELEQFPLDSLVMAGTIGTGADLVGLVMAPNKVVYRVRPGAYMGQSDGRVTSVHEDRIELVELVPDGAGGWLERPASIARDNQ